MRMAINGFGRIGRQALRVAWEYDDVEIVPINDVGDAATLAHLLQYDTTYGIWKYEVEAEDDAIVVDGQRISVSAEKDPGALPWQTREVDVVLKSTGKFTRPEDVQRHLDAGARKVLISAPSKNPVDGDFILGVNEDTYEPDKHHIVTIGSCTTNSLAPLVKVLHEELCIERGLMTTVHAYTSGQNLLDGPAKDLRRARAAAENIAPTTTGAAKMISRIFPDLEGKLDGMAIRVPVPCGSITDLVCHVERETSVEEVNEALRRRAEVPMAGILDVTEEPIVSSDIVGDPHSAIVPLNDTKVQDGRLVKVLSWYDNEWAFSNRLIEMRRLMMA